MTTLAHMGGVPEALAFVVPMVFVVILLRLGAKKAPPPEPQEPEGPPGDDQQAI